MYDLLIENARIVDGTGAPAYSGSLAVKDGRIVAMGSVHSREAREVINAAGQVGGVLAERKPAAEIMADLVSGTIAALDGLPERVRTAA